MDGEGVNGPTSKATLLTGARTQCPCAPEPCWGFLRVRGKAIVAGTTQTQDIRYMAWITGLALDVMCREYEWGAPNPQEGHGEDSPIQRCTFQGFC